MKRLVFSLVLALGLTVALAPVANAFVKPGTKCSIAGVKLVYKDKTYTCIKLGKNLYWDNGVKKVLQTSTPIPTPSATVIAIPTPTSVIIPNSWVEYVACLDSYKSPIGSLFSSTFCKKYYPEASNPVRSYTEYATCQKFGRESTVGLFFNCEPWQP